MKRFFAVFFVTFALIGVLLYAMPRNFGDYVGRLALSGKVNIYCKETTLQGFDVGFCQIVQCDASDLAKTLDSCSGVDGISVSFDGAQKDVQRIVTLLNVEALTEYQLGDVIVFCGFSNKLSGGVTLEGKRVNVQIAYSNGTVTVGSPLILGSY